MRAGNLTILYAEEMPSMKAILFNLNNMIVGHRRSKSLFIFSSFRGEESKINETVFRNSKADNKRLRQKFDSRILNDYQIYNYSLQAEMK